MKNKFLALICGALLSFFPNCAWANNYEDNSVAVGKSDVGELYVDLDNVQILRKSNAAYLIASVEERYSDKKFMDEIRKKRGLENAVGTLTLYMFDNYGRTYCIVGKHIYDSNGNMCLDLGSDMTIKEVGRNEMLLKIYEVSLKSLEKKSQIRSWGKR